MIKPKPIEALKQSINTFFTGIVIQESSLPDTNGEYIYLIHSDKKILWFTSAHNRDIQQIKGINSFLRLNSAAFTETKFFGDNPLIQIKKVKYKLEQNAACRISNLKLCKRTSMAFQTASGKSLISIILPGKVGQVIKISRLKQNLRNEFQALRNINPKIVTPKPLRFNELNNGFSVSAQTLLRGLPLDNSISDKNIALVLKKLTNTEAQFTSIREQSESLLESLKEKNLTDNQKKHIESLLVKNQSKTSVISSRIHGDLRPANMLKCLSHDENKNSIQLGLLDWEFSKPTGIGITDFLRWKLDFAYTKAISFEELFHLSNISEIKKIMPKLDIPGNTLPLNELLRLHIAMHAIDRFHSFWTPNSTNNRLNNLEKILNSKRPIDLD